jgi:UDP-galactopyranose mutase
MYILEKIEVKLEVDYLKDKEYWNSITDKVIYTGPIDAFFEYKFGELEYKTTKFEHKRIECDNYQGIAMMNYTDKDVPFTRCVEHKHFEETENSLLSKVGMRMSREVGDFLQHVSSQIFSNNIRNTVDSEPCFIQTYTTNGSTEFLLKDRKSVV